MPKIFHWLENMFSYKVEDFQKKHEDKKRELGPENICLLINISK